MKHVEYQTERLVCSRKISFDLENNNIYNIKFEGGCPGNLLAIAKLLEGQSIDFVIEKLKGNKCGNKPSSCTDQLVKAIEQNRE